MLLSVRTNAGPWKNHKQARIDAKLASMDSTIVDIDWKRHSMEDDGKHFTRDGFHSFTDDLVEKISPILQRKGVAKLVIYADSTIDYNNWVWTQKGKEWKHVNVASAHLRRAFFTKGIETRVDAVSGSGFIRLSYKGQHFRARLSRDRRARVVTNEFAVLVIGGWNDVNGGYALDRICLAVESFATLANSK